MATSVPAQLTDEVILAAEPEGILGQRFNGNSGQEEVLVKWKDQPNSDCSWEWTSKIKALFPHFKMILPQEGYFQREGY